MVKVHIKAILDLNLGLNLNLNMNSHHSVFS
jgi:hypothetical protein